MRTPVVVVSGQVDTGGISEVLLARAGTTLVEHRFDGHVVHRRTASVQCGVTLVADAVLELAHGCVSCTVREDLLTHLSRLHRRSDTARIVVRLGPWMEPEPVCFAISRTPTARDVSIAAVVTAVDSCRWLSQAVGDDELADGRTVAQVVVGQVEFADVVVLTGAHAATLAVTRRLAPRARLTVGTGRLELALSHLDRDARRGRSDDPHGSLLHGQPALDVDGAVRLVEFGARRPFHPQRLHSAIGLLLDGVVRSRGRLWIASRPDQAMWLESAGGGLRVTPIGKWLADMTSGEIAYADPERRAMADLIWEPRAGDRHTSLVALVCGADPDDIARALHGAVLTDLEMERPETWRHFHDPFGDWETDESRLA